MHKEGGERPRPIPPPDVFRNDPILPRNFDISILEYASPPVPEGAYPPSTLADLVHVW